jgi:hypothetical protein
MVDGENAELFLPNLYPVATASGSDSATALGYLLFGQSPLYTPRFCRNFLKAMSGNGVSTVGT